MDGLEQVDGNASFVSRREPAWHSLGKIVTEDQTKAQIMSLANLDNWNVRLVPLAEMMPATLSTHLDKQVVIRDNPFYDDTKKDEPGYDQAKNNLLGVVGGRYSVLQNEDLFTFAEDLLIGGRWETAGSIAQGTTVFASLALDTEIVIDPSGADDKINNYLLVSTSHDGSSAITAATTPVRVVCQNTLNMALKGAKNAHRVRHTQTHQERLNEVVKTLQTSAKYLDVFAADAKAMFETKVTNAEFERMIEAAFPKPDAAIKSATTRWNKNQDILMGLWGGKSNANIAGTAWAAVNAFTESAQWGRAIYKGNSENFFASGAGFDDASNNERTRLANIVRTLANV
jgi:phage/plasmid-like protein (TIGR03299 family)